MTELEHSLFYNYEDPEETFYKCSSGHEEVKWYNSIGNRCWYCNEVGESVFEIMQVGFSRYEV